MCLVTKLSIFYALIGTHLLGVFSSIHFDEVEFYDPNMTLDESTSNGFKCAHLGEKCQITPQCCGVATCALPSWSESPVCLVPGYKHDERFRKRFFSVHNLRPADIRYIRDTYNTSKYDFLLTDLTFSAPPLNSANTSGEELDANNSVYNETADAFSDLDRNNSGKSTFAESLIENNVTLNVSLEESYEIDPETGSNNTKIAANYSALINNSLPLPATNSSDTSQNYKFDFKNHFKFLLVNNSLKEDKFDYKTFYDQVINTDRFKNVLEELKQKMREINEKENNYNDEISATNFTKGEVKVEINQPMIEIFQTTQKPSKWNVVKRFLLQNRKILNENKNFTNKINFHNTINESVNDVKSKEDNSQENDKIEKMQSDYLNNENENDGFRKLIEDVDKIEEIIDRDQTINTFHKVNNINSEEGIFDFYNIKVPFDSIVRDENKTNPLEMVFEDLGDTIHTMIIKNDNKDKPLSNFLDEKPTSVNDSKILVSNESYSTQNHTLFGGINFWNKIHFWKIPQNKTAEVDSSFKRIFYRKEKASSTEKPNTPLNEYFLLNLNKKNNYETVTPSQVEKIKQNPEYSSSASSSESESSVSDELYNNSYVFMVHKEHVKDPVMSSNWEKLLNFFHKEKVVPLSIDVNLHDIPSGISGVGSDSEKNTKKISKIIRLPEYLMPQVLEERQRNETDWIFQDSDETEEGVLEEHKSSNSSFLFFFK